MGMIYFFIGSLIVAQILFFVLIHFVTKRIDFIQDEVLPLLRVLRGEKRHDGF